MIYRLLPLYSTPPSPCFLFLHSVILTNCPLLSFLSAISSPSSYPPPLLDLLLFLHLFLSRGRGPVDRPLVLLFPRPPSSSLIFSSTPTLIFVSNQPPPTLLSFLSSSFHPSLPPPPPPPSPSHSCVRPPIPTLLSCLYSPSRLFFSFHLI